MDPSCISLPNISCLKIVLLSQPVTATDYDLLCIFAIMKLNSYSGCKSTT